MSQPLEGIRVLELGSYIAGPFCGMLLGDMGADVIKIERPPRGDQTRAMPPMVNAESASFAALNRNKRSLVLDLKQQQARDIVHALVGKVDVVVQNFVPGAAEKLGIDYDTLSRINERIIFLSSTAFGEVGPYRKRKGFDIIAHAASGVMSNYADEEGAPRGPGGPPYIDIGTGMLNALAIVGALYHRDKSGEGQKIETSLFSTGMALQAMSMIHVDSLDAAQHEEEKRVLRTAHGEGKKHTQIVDQFAQMRLRADQPDTVRPVEVPDCLHRPTDRQVYPYYRVYETGDGYIGVAALNRNQRASLCTALGIPDEHVDKNLGEISDEIYFRQKAQMRVIEDRLKQKPNRHWMQVLEAAGVPCGPVNYRSDLYTDPQALALNLIWEVGNRDLGKYKTSGHPIRFLKTPAAPGKGAPALGEDTATVLRQFGYGDEEIARLKAAGIVK